MATIHDFQLDPLPEGWRPTEVLVITKCVVLDEGSDNIHRLSLRSSDGLTSWEAIGMLEAYAADLKQQFLESLGE